MQKSRVLLSVVAVTAIAATPAIVSSVGAPIPAPTGVTSSAPAVDASPAPAVGAAPIRYPEVPIVAHRGASRATPEETIAAYRTAIDQRTDVIEGDVQLTKDGHLVLLHDGTLARTTDVESVFPERADARVGQFTLAEITQLDAGSWFDDRFRAETVPTVDEVLDLIDPRATGVTFELKDAEYSPGVAAALAVKLADKGLVDAARTRTGAYRIMVHSRSQPALREFAEQLPEVPLVYLTGGPMLDDAELAELSSWTVGVFSDPRTTTAADIERAHAVGLKVYNDPVDSDEQMTMALAQGYDYLVTNIPGAAREVRSPRRGPARDVQPVVIDHVVSNPSGDDMQWEFSEHVTLRNNTDRTVDISGYALRDNGNTRLVIRDDALLQPGSLFRVHVGAGPDKPDASYSDNGRGILNNTDGDTLVLYDRDGGILDTYSFILPAE